MNHLVLEKKANDFRNVLGIGGASCIQLNSLLYKLNVLTVFKPLSSGFSGMAVKVANGDDVKRFILINSAHPKGKQNFTICHELYHLYIQENFTTAICTTGVFDRKGGEEYNADVFASYLLLPENGIMSLIPDRELGSDRISLTTILKIEQYFGSSRAALLYRLKHLKIIDSEYYDLYSKNVKRGAVELGYTTDLYEEGNHNQVIGDYGSVARELYEKEKISESHYYSLLLDLGMNVEEIEKLNNGEG